MNATVLAEPPGGWDPPWPLLVEVARQTEPVKWTLVGGLMVQAHAMLAGVSPTRSTTDVDLLLDLLTRRASTARVAAGLGMLGFTVQEPGWEGSPVHRFRRGTEVIDVLVADHLPRSLRPRIAGRSVMAIDGGAQALERSTQLRVRTGATEAEILLPNLLGALILKAAASRVDRRDNGRHLQDAALIAALITDHGAARANMHGSDRRRLMGLAAALADPASPAWLTLPSDLAQQGQDTLRILTA